MAGNLVLPAYASKSKILRKKLERKIADQLEVEPGSIGLSRNDGLMITSRYWYINGQTVNAFVRDSVGNDGNAARDRGDYSSHVVTCAYSNTRGHSKEKLMAIKIATAQDRDFVANELNLTEIDVVQLANGIGGWAKIISGNKYVSK